MKSLSSFEAYGERISVSGKTVAASEVGVIQSTRIRLTMSVGRSRAIDGARLLVGDRRVRQRDHRLAPEDRRHDVRAGRRVQPAEDDVRPDRGLQPRGLERDALLLVATRTGRDDAQQLRALDRQAVDRGLVPVGQAVAHDVVDAEPLLPVEEVAQPLAEHREPAGDRAILGKALEHDGLHGAPNLARGRATGYGTFVPVVTARSLVDLERAVGDLDQDPAVLDHHRVDRERQLRRRVERLAVGQVEARQVERAGERARGQEALVELEVLVAADALDGRQVAVRC